MKDTEIDYASGSRIGYVLVQSIGEKFNLVTLESR